MKKSLKTFLLTIVSSLALLVPAVVAPIAVHAAADIENALCNGSALNFTADPASCSTTNNAETKVNSIVTLVINIFSVVVGIIAVIMIILGGIKYVTSGGDTGKVTSAQQTILYAIVGLIIVALAQVLVRFVLNRVTTATP